MKNLTDQDSIAGCISGNDTIMEEFVRRFSDPVYRAVQYALRSKNFTYRQEDVEDLHNTIFVKLFEEKCKKLKQYRGDKGCSLLTWIRLIAVRTVIDHIRKIKKDALSQWKDALPIETMTDLEAESFEPIKMIEKDEHYHLIQEGMKEMKPRYQLFLKLHFFKGLSITEAAEILSTRSCERKRTIKNRTAL